MNINTRQLKAAILVSEHGSFTKAAEHLHISQSGLSALVKELEDQLGFRLFERTTRRVVLTEAGHQFLLLAKSIEQNLRLSIKDIASAVAGEQRNIRIAASPAMVSGILPDVLQHHLNSHPEDTIELLDVSRSEIVPQVEAGNAGMGMGIFFRPLSGIRQFRLFSSSLILISPSAWTPNALHAEQGIISIDHVPATALIRLTHDNPFQQWVDNRLLAANKELHETNTRMRLHNIESCVAMVEMGVGHFIAPDFIVPVCKRYNVGARRIYDVISEIDFYAVMRAGTEPATIARDFINSFLKTIIKRQIGERHPEKATQAPLSSRH